MDWLAAMLFIEGGHSVQNVRSQAFLGAWNGFHRRFNDDKVKEIVNFEVHEESVFIMPVGRRIKKSHSTVKDVLIFLEK
jgi:hypothetical protein